MGYKQKTIWLIVLATIVRGIVASVVELGNDEVYYRMYAQYLQWNYFDHPPMVGWLIRLTTLNLAADNEFFIRLAPIICAAITSWLLFLCGKKIQNERAGFLAALIYTATLYGTIIAGVFILPDAPQLVCWVAGLYLLIDITSPATDNHIKQRKILLFGLVAGLGMLCKIHTSFLWFGFLLYMLFYERRLFRNGALYVSGIITILLFYPVIKWNIDNHFITYFFHSERINVAHAGLNLDSFFTFAGGQFFYYNPIVFVFICIAQSAAFRNKLPIFKKKVSLLLFCSLPLLGAALLISISKEVLPHWTGPAYTGLILITASYFTKAAPGNISLRRIIPRPLLSALILSAVIVIGGILVVNFYPGTLGKKVSPVIGDGDFTLDMYGWRMLKDPFETIVRKDMETGLMKKDALIISNKWFPAAHLDYYIAMPLHKDLLAIGDANDIHQYLWINKERKHLAAGDDAYCLVPSENYLDVSEQFGLLFSAIFPADTIYQERNGKRCRALYVYKFKGFLPTGFSNK